MDSNQTRHANFDDVRDRIANAFGSNVTHFSRSGLPATDHASYHHHDHHRHQDTSRSTTTGSSSSNTSNTNGKHRQHHHYHLVHGQRDKDRKGSKGSQNKSKTKQKSADRRFHMTMESVSEGSNTSSPVYRKAWELSETDDTTGSISSWMDNVADATTGTSTTPPVDAPVQKQHQSALPPPPSYTPPPPFSDPFADPVEPLSTSSSSNGNYYYAAPIHYNTGPAPLAVAPTINVNATLSSPPPPSSSSAPIPAGQLLPQPPPSQPLQPPHQPVVTDQNVTPPSNRPTGNAAVAAAAAIMSKCGRTPVGSHGQISRPARYGHGSGGGGGGFIPGSAMPGFAPYAAQQNMTTPPAPHPPHFSSPSSLPPYSSSSSYFYGPTSTYYTSPPPPAATTTPTPTPSTPSHRQQRHRPPSVAHIARPATSRAAFAPGTVINTPPPEFLNSSSSNYQNFNSNSWSQTRAQSYNYDYPSPPIANSQIRQQQQSPLAYESRPGNAYNSDDGWNLAMGVFDEDFSRMSLGSRKGRGKK